MEKRRVQRKGEMEGSRVKKQTSKELVKDMDEKGVVRKSQSVMVGFQRRSCTELAETSDRKTTGKLRRREELFVSLTSVLGRKRAASV